ncbi:type II toxin-antitoxin system RelE/ParE family toxin [Dehalococcoidales bacterium]|nr:type II toxin-antitoxin system RelE/ParE family toxin [Dehalococcoidales bacterium]
MKYEVRIVPAAEREMDKLPTPVHTRLSRRILSLEGNPRPRGAKKLGGREEYRLRVGDYRVLYTIDDKGCMVTVFAVGHRREVYR